MIVLAVIATVVCFVIAILAALVMVASGVAGVLLMMGVVTAPASTVALAIAFAAGILIVAGSLFAPSDELKRIQKTMHDEEKHPTQVIQDTGTASANAMAHWLK